MAVHRLYKRQPPVMKLTKGLRACNNNKKIMEDTDQISCPVPQCNFNGSLSGVIHHVTGTDDQYHAWKTLGYQHSWEYRSSHTTDSGGDETDTTADEYEHQGKSDQRDNTETDSDPDSDSADNFICDSCGYGFKYENPYRRHKHSCQTKSEREADTDSSSDSNTDSDSKFVCDNCGDSFKFKSPYRRHGYSCDRSADEHDSQSTENPAQYSAPSPLGWTVNSLAAATELDTDDVEDAVDRVVTAGCSREVAIGYVRRYLKEMLQEEGLFSVHGVGPKIGSSLLRAGITTTSELRGITPSNLSNKIDLSTAHIQRLQEAAQAGDFASFEPDNERAAEKLVDPSLGAFTQENAEQQHSDSDEDPATGLTELNQLNTELSELNAESNDESGSTSGNYPPPVDDSRPEALTPRELDIPTYRSYTAPRGGEIYRNHLSEFYESFYDVSRVLSVVFQISGTDIDPEDRRDPRVQYYILIKACLGFYDDSVPFGGYGSQHNDRLPFSMEEYREVFGNDGAMTEYHVIDVEPFKQETHDIFRGVADVNPTKEFVRPCVPGTAQPIPELPGSLGELQDALFQLATFPAYPPLSTETGVNNRTIPIADVYRTCFKDLDQTHQVDLTPFSETPNGN